MGAPAFLGPPAQATSWLSYQWRWAAPFPMNDVGRFTLLVMALAGIAAAVALVLLAAIGGSP